MTTGESWQTEWRRFYAPILKTLAGRQVLVLFSGGKDSSLVLSLLCDCAAEYDFRLAAHAACFPSHRYPETEVARLDAFWQSKGVRVTWHAAPEDDTGMDSSATPCRDCQQVRRCMLTKELDGLVDEWRRLVLVAGYSLRDLVSYSIEHLLGDVLSAGAPPSTGRFDQTAQRFYPLATMPEGYTVLRPLVQTDAGEIEHQIRRRGLPILAGKCRFADRRPKRVWEEYYRRSGAQFEYGRLMAFARRCLDLPPVEAYTGLDREKYLGKVF